jgi:hypothetical protein
MKKFSFILRVISSALVILLALVFTVLEVTLLVTLDFALYENGLLAFVQLFLKLLIAMAAGALGLLSLIKRARPFLKESIGLLVSSAVMLPFISNGFGIYITAVCALFMLSQLLFAKTHNSIGTFNAAG